MYDNNLYVNRCTWNTLLMKFWILYEKLFVYVLYWLRMYVIFYGKKSFALKKSNKHAQSGVIMLQWLFYFMDLNSTLNHWWTFKINLQSAAFQYKFDDLMNVQNNQTLFFICLINVLRYFKLLNITTHAFT